MKGHNFDKIREHLSTKGYNVYGATEDELNKMFEDDEGNKKEGKENGTIRN
jgi:hypothetical protein